MKTVVMVCLLALICGCSTMPNYTSSPIVKEKVINPYWEQDQYFWVGGYGFPIKYQHPYQRYITVIGTNNVGETEEYSFYVSQEEYNSAVIGKTWTIK